MGKSGGGGGRSRPEVSAPVRAELARLLGGADIELVAEATDTLPSGETVRLVTAAAAGSANRCASVAVDAGGAVVERATLEQRAGRPLFVGDLHLPTGAVPVPPRRPVTVDPPVNRLSLPECAVEKEKVTVTVPKSGVRPKADVYLLADTTGSMFPVIDAVKLGVTAIVSDPALAGYDVAWGVGNYKDFPVGELNPYAFTHQLSPTTVTAPAIAAVTAWSASDGADTPEGQLYALHQLATDPAIGWRADSRRIVVWLGDAPGHDPICTAISGLGADVTEASATADLVGADVTVVAVSTTTGVPDGLDGDPAVGSTDYGACPVGGTAGQASRITAATGGSHTSGVDVTAIVTTLSELIAAAVTSIASLTLVPTGDIVEFVDSITPAGYGPLPGDTEHTLPFHVTWRGVRDCAKEDRIFTGTLDVVADGVVVAHKPVRVVVPACRWHHVVEMVCGLEPPERRDKCETVVDGRYATAVTVYNPTHCTVKVRKHFVPLVIGDRAVREPKVSKGRPLPPVELAPGEATMDDCCTLLEADLPGGGGLVLGVLDIVSDQPLEVTAIHTATGVAPRHLSASGRDDDDDDDGPRPAGRGCGSTIHTRAITPRRE